MADFEKPALREDELDLVVNDASIPNSVNMELTGRCNLRCQYCGTQKGPEYRKVDISDELIDKSLELLNTPHLEEIDLSATGEITYIANFDKIIDRYLSLGIRLRTITNLSLPLTWENAQSLARLNRLIVSIDTADQAILKKTRKAVDLRTIITNIAMIRAAAVETGIQAPLIEFNAVGHADSIAGFERLVALAAAIGANHVSLYDTVFNYPEHSEGGEVRHVSTLPPGGREQVLKALSRATDLAGKYRIGLFIAPHIIHCLRGGEVETTSSSSDGISSERTAVPVREGETRNCLLPWEFLTLRANGEVQRCCGSHGGEVLSGSWQDAASLSAIMTSGHAKQLRRELLTGNLSPLCRSCNIAMPVPISQFQLHVLQSLANRYASRV